MNNQSLGCGCKNYNTTPRFLGGNLGYLWIGPIFVGILLLLLRTNRPIDEVLEIQE